MMMVSRFGLIVTFAFLTVFVPVSNAALNDSSISCQQGYLTDECLRCICKGMSPAGECNPDTTENEKMFQITYAYWNESGRPTVDEGATNDSEIDFRNCVNQYNCSEMTVWKYMLVNLFDSNWDMYKNCYDAVAIHYLYDRELKTVGPHSSDEELPDDFKRHTDHCIYKDYPHLSVCRAIALLIYNGTNDPMMSFEYKIDGTTPK